MTEGIDVHRLAQAIDDHFRTGRHGYSSHACAAAIIAIYGEASRERPAMPERIAKYAHQKRPWTADDLDPNVR